MTEVYQLVDELTQIFQADALWIEQETRKLVRNYKEDSLDYEGVIQLVGRAEWVLHDRGEQLSPWLRYYLGVAHLFAGNGLKGEAYLRTLMADLDNPDLRQRTSVYLCLHYLGLMNDDPAAWVEASQFDAAQPYWELLKTIPALERGELLRQEYPKLSRRVSLIRALSERNGTYFLQYLCPTQEPRTLTHTEPFPPQDPVPQVLIDLVNQTVAYKGDTLRVRLSTLELFSLAWIAANPLSHVEDDWLNGYLRAGEAYGHIRQMRTRHEAKNLPMAFQASIRRLREKLSGASPRGRNLLLNEGYGFSENLSVAVFSEKRLNL